MARYFEGKTRSNPNRSAKSAWLPPTKGLRDWRKDMKEPDIAVFEGLTRDLLEELGYELSGIVPAGEVAEKIKSAEEWWQTQPMSRH